MRSGLALLTLALSSVYAKPRGTDNGRGNDANNDSVSSVSSAPSSTATSTPTTNSTSSSSSSSSLIGMNGGAVCTNLMCIGGLVNGSTVQYTLQSLGRTRVGWMAIGFGAQMADSPMVILWPNTDGSVTLSQRQASSEVMPTVVSNPPRTATLEQSLSVVSGTNPKLVFTIPSDGNEKTGKSTIIWAFGGTGPGSSAVDASLTQHLNSGPTQIDLSQSLTANSIDPTNPVSTIAQSTSSSSGSASSASTSGDQVFSGIPLLPYQKYIIAHAILSMLGFLVFLPLGAIIARWLRTFSSIWFTAHWVLQFGVAMPIIVTGFALGVHAVKLNGVQNLADTHMKWGVALFVLYWVQVCLGAIIHFFKPAGAWLRVRGRTFQNYFHAILGLFIIGVSFYQVRTGFRTEWPLYTGRGKVRNGANIAWIVWLVLIPTFYFSGVVLLLRLTLFVCCRNPMGGVISDFGEGGGVGEG
ncbi:hypothetical protein BDY19DRAFT_987219 [Irpex rosettiformis]|uniref:Uncharacterized protein n=1 Tax=Irpex rosettiformis TaxID=378272 RepID=A0ACB8TST4_9APHY|nr:hypothetical protein BDY19DRAFT_987219 [Irpex rosettiformis]